MVKIKNERITFRLTETEKEEVILNAKKQELDDLTESQAQFLALFDIAYQKSSNINVKKMLVLLNKINFNTTLLIQIMDIFMKQLKVPQNKDDVITTFVEHPIVSIAEEKVLKDFRNKKHNREEMKNSD
jgi:hypothetical protein